MHPSEVRWRALVPLAVNLRAHAPRGVCLARVLGVDPDVVWERFNRLLERLGGYPFWQVALELSVIWLIVYVIIRFVQGTRAAGALKGTLLLVVMTTLLIRVIGYAEAFQRLKFLYEHFVTLLAITLIVVFQPELRRGLIRLGETPLLRRSSPGNAGVPDAIADACGYLSKAKFGAIIVLERENPLKGLTEGGTLIHGRASARLLQTIFFPGSALHDLAVVVRAGEIVSAGVQLPLADPEEMPDATLGSRHRAAVGLSKECDALVVVVSEETGAISIAERGRLDRPFTADTLRTELARRLKSTGALAATSSDAHTDPNNESALSMEPAELTDPRD